MSLISLILMVCLMQGFPHVQALHISGKFWNGDVQFSWDNTLQSYDEFYITRGDTIDRHDWQKSYNNSYLFRSVIRYPSVTITVYEAVKGKRHNFTYKVSKVESVIDKTTTLSMPLNNLNLSCSRMYQVRWNDNKMLEKQLLMIRENKLQEYDASKYQQVKLSNASNTMTFEIKNVAPEDAGFYAWGSNASDALSRPGVMLVVHKKPLTPNISGTMREVVGNISHLTCSSELNTFPAYYSKLLAKRYSWFLNDTKLSGAIRKTLSVNVTKMTKYDRYSCTASDMLKSNRSNVVKIDPLYGPDQVSFDPQPIQLKTNIVVTLKEGDMFGPYNCLADCNPPCTFTWKYKNITTTDFVGVASDGGYLLSQRVKRDIKMFRCIAEGLYGKPVKGSIYLHVLYMESPQFYLNDDSTPRTSADVQEGNVLRLSCFVEGNPTPRVQLSKRHHKRDVVLSDSTTHWSNYSFEREVMCSDSGVYDCASWIEGFGLKQTQINLNILCDPRYEHGDQLELYSGDAIGLDKAIIVKIPVTSHPPPNTSKMTWIGPDDQTIDARSVVSQQNDDDIFNHLIISIVQITDAGKYGEYRVLYNSYSLINFTVNENDLHTTVFQGFNNEICRVSELALLTAAIVSTFLAVILISVILVFCCSKRDTKERTNNEVYMDTAARKKVWESEPCYNNTTDDIYFYSTLNDAVEEEEL
ncbi:uncharacterized protein LOC111116862 [Crassostrea virginica]